MPNFEKPTNLPPFKQVIAATKPIEKAEKPATKTHTFDKPADLKYLAKQAADSPNFLAVTGLNHPA